MKQFEYNAHNSFGEFRQRDLLETLDVYGSEGWELVAVLPIVQRFDSQSEHGQRMLFKREIIPKSSK